MEREWMGFLRAENGMDMVGKPGSFQKPKWLPQCFLSSILPESWQVATHRWALFQVRVQMMQQNQSCPVDSI